tara:strand:- start:323 stop:493 length:171 start_codon:yes stop_codon:yes gene_type:complete
MVQKMLYLSATFAAFLVADVTGKVIWGMLAGLVFLSPVMVKLALRFISAWAMIIEY